MVSRVAWAYNGGVGWSPQWVQGQSPWSGGLEEKSSEADTFLAFEMKAANLPTFFKFENWKNLCQKMKLNKLQYVTDYGTCTQKHIIRGSEA